MDRLRMRPPLLLGQVALLALCSCGPADSGISPAARSRTEGLVLPRLQVVAAQDRQAFEVMGPQGQVLAVIPVQSTLVDRLEADVCPQDGRVMAALQHGEAGGTSLILAGAGRPPSTLLRTGQGTTLGRPVWSPGCERIALVRLLPPAWVRGRDSPMLQLQGELWITDPQGAMRRVDMPGDMARVLTWLDQRTLLVTRFEPGDMPRESLHRLHLPGGWMEQVLPRAEGELIYSIALAGGHLVYARADSPVVTLPAAGQKVDLVVADLQGRTVAAAPLPSGSMLLGASLVDQGQTLRLVLEGTSLQGRLELSHREARLETRPYASRSEVPPLPTGVLAGSLTLPYIHQVYDTPNSFNGSWACGPTSTVMALVYFGRLSAWPITVSIPSSHTSNYGAYVSTTYTAYGTTFNRMQTDPSGKAAYGAYGWCTDGGGAWAWRMQDYAKKHGLKSDFAYVSSITPIKQDLDAGKVVVLSTKLTSAGHIVAVKGYTTDGRLVTNDPYGDKNKGYKNYYGENATYTWSELGSKWYITVYGTVVKPDPEYKATLQIKSAPSSMTSGSKASATLTYKNEGTATWNSQTRLGTTSPQDRQSAFYTQGSWLSTSRPAAAPASVKTGSSATFTFTLTAPKVCKDTEYIEHFNLVQEGKAWFSDSGQGGPTDTAVSLKIKVSPLDADGDKHNSCTDCNDADPKIFPGATEVCNGKDDDCDGKVDEGPSCAPGTDQAPGRADGTAGPGTDAGSGPTYPSSGEGELSLSGGCMVSGGHGPAGLPLAPCTLILLLFLCRFLRREKDEQRAR